MRTVQEIFNLMIESGRYSYFNEFMCNCLTQALEAGEITPEERESVQTEIDIYLNGWGVLSVYLWDLSGTQKGYADCLEVYQDWDNRPYKGLTRAQAYEMHEANRP